MQTFDPVMKPSPGERLLRFVGDTVRFEAGDRDYQSPRQGWRALLRTNLGRGEQLRREILVSHTRGLAPAGASWRDIPMQAGPGGWSLELPLVEPGFFKAKAYLLDPRGWQHWPGGGDVGISVHPDAYRTGNTLYCAFARLFGETKIKTSTSNASQDQRLTRLDSEGYTVIPPSGKLQDLTLELPHIFETLRCKILHLLPVNPTPTTYARFGRFGSPYAILDLTAIDPALVVFDKKRTGEDQFRELTYAAHLHGGRVFLDMVINHTGWGSVLQETHPEWFIRNSDGTFASPGAWGTTWEDLVELKHQNVQLWDELAEAFLTWCRRGVDGFRCDAGYKVPMAAWQYIIARVQQEYPETIFFLEGLGGAWETTESLVTEGGMQWAYSELFQNYTGVQVGGYLDHSLKQSERVGVLVHYSETHDNERLAARGRNWSLLRNLLCGLTSTNGAFGFTCGAEWLAKEKIRVHGCTGLAWGNKENLVPELATLNSLLAEHPCFFDGATLVRLSPIDSPVYALLRISQEKADCVLVLINTVLEKPGQCVLDKKRIDDLWSGGGAAIALSSWVDLLGQTGPKVESAPGGKLVFQLPASAACCLSPARLPQGLHGEAYRRARRQAAWAFSALSHQVGAECIRGADWRVLAAAVERSPAEFLTNLPAFAQAPGLAKPTRRQAFPNVVVWSLLDLRRITLVPPGHWLLIEDDTPFRANLTIESGASEVVNIESIPAAAGHFACFPPRESGSDAWLKLERYASGERHVEAQIRFLGPGPAPALKPSNRVLLTNARGGMARMCIDLGRVSSKYDCALGANLHPTLPVDRHIFIKRIRVWVNADGFISPLDFQSLQSFSAGPPAVWDFIANAGDGRTVQIQMTAEMPAGRNAIVFKFKRPSASQASGKQLPAQADVRLTVRLDLEDRNFHCETRRNDAADYHFSTHTHSVLAGAGEGSSGSLEQTAPRFRGFNFTPSGDRQLLVMASGGLYHPQPEWSENIAHPVEQSRGQPGSGDAYSPGWFELPLPKGAAVVVTATAEPADFAALEAGTDEPDAVPVQQRQAPPVAPLTFEQKLRQAVSAFVVKRGQGKTVIAGYPWFLDWGRDTFICARGMLAAGMAEEVKQIVLIFSRFEKNGTLPNTIFGDDASNRDTSDAPLWFGVVCEELSSILGPIHQLAVTSERSLLDVLRSIASNYLVGTSNGIRVDAQSGLVWSPRHFSWMDTNYPAATPREGYPVEIQALWIRLLRYLARIDSSESQRWEAAAAKAIASVERLFWLPTKGYYSDLLSAAAGQPATEAAADDALRSNNLFLVSLGLVTGERAKSCVAAALRYLVVPGALRSLAPLPVTQPLPVYGNDGRLLNDPHRPYWARYEGDEDTRRKPAYHNGTAWTWTFPVACEALARAWEFSPPAVAAAKAYLGSMERLMDEGCLGQIPEVFDGDRPHNPRGCDAQAWAATEALRVLLLLGGK